MNLTTKTLILGLVLVGGLAYAEGATDPDVKARQDLMDANGGAMKVLSGFAKGTVPFDAAAAAAAKETLVANAEKVAEVFKNQATDPASHAKGAIWTSWDDFLGKTKDFATASEALDTTSVDTVKAGLGAIGGACGACHTAYKAS